MRAETGFVDFEPLQRLAQELDRAAHRSHHARQAYIATRGERDLREWREALHHQRGAWTRYWRLHQEILEALEGTRRPGDEEMVRSTGGE